MTKPASAPAPAVAGRVAVSPLEDLLHLLARAVQQLHTYPATSPLCRKAVDACAAALAALDRDQVVFRVTPSELVVDDTPVGRGSAIEHELARRFHAAGIAEVSIDRAASPRELTHLCLDLVRCSGTRDRRPALVEVLAEHGVDRIALRAARRPEVLTVARADEHVAALVQEERRRQEDLFAREGASSHLYPPDRGWVRLDPSSPLASVSLAELALLAESPERLAEMLMRLTDDDTAPADGGPLTRKFSEVATLFSALEPRIARAMLSRLARAVLDLEPETRQALLRRTILPGLLDGRVDGLVLRDFPDLELADSLCLLLDLETAAPEVVTTALGRLDLPPERQSAVAPLVEERLSGRAAPRARGLDAHAKKLVAIGHGRVASFAEFSAFDLALDGSAAAALAGIRDGILEEDPVIARLECVWHLARLEPNPEAVQRLVDSATALFDDLQRDGRDETCASWMRKYRELCAALCENRPDVARTIGEALASMCTPARVARIVDLAASGDAGRAAADSIVEALAPEVAAPLLEIAQGTDGGGRDPRGRTALALLCDHAASLAPALAPAAASAPPPAARIVARVLGRAGAGYEAALGTQLESRDERTVREALRALARIGSPDAARLVCRRIEEADGHAGAAEETLWRFPAAEARRHARALLARREFVLRRPAAALRLMDRAAQGGDDALGPVLEPLARLRYRVWRPALSRVGRRARALVKR